MFCTDISAAKSSTNINKGVFLNQTKSSLQITDNRSSSLSHNQKRNSRNTIAKLEIYKNRLREKRNFGTQSEEKECETKEQDPQVVVKKFII